ncbi:MAG: hypothetical protein KAV00_10435 [Phycisphaerae bacterium]|nr:hypothetical protein [Phycisphaerae bacterium]
MENGKEIEVKIDANGKLLSREIEDDDEEDEVEVSLDKVPAAVRATILKHAGKNKIHEIEKETKRGKTIYEAEWRENGKEIEIKVAADGKLISKKIDDDDDDHDDDDHDDDDDDDDDD